MAIGLSPKMFFLIDTYARRHWIYRPIILRVVEPRYCRSPSGTAEAIWRSVRSRGPVPSFRTSLLETDSLTDQSDGHVIEGIYSFVFFFRGDFHQEIPKLHTPPT